MNRQFAIVLGVSLVFAAGVSASYYLALSGAQLGTLFPVVVSILAILAIVYFGVLPSSREHRRVEAVLEDSIGLRPWHKAMAENLTWKKAVGGGVEAYWTPRRGLAPGLVLLILVSAGLLLLTGQRMLGAGTLLGLLFLSSLRSGLSWAERAVGLFQSAGFFLILGWSELFPGKSMWPLVLHVGVASILIGMYARSSKNGTAAALAVRYAYNQGDYARALAEAAKLTGELPFDRNGELTALALAHYRRREFAEAEALLRQSISAQPEGARAAALCVNLAAVYLEQRRYSDAERTLEAAAKLDATNAAINPAHALLLLRQGVEPERALNLAGEAAGRSGTDLSMVVHAWALAENGRSGQARQALASRDHVVGRAKPDAAERSYYAGRALLRCGDGEAASVYFRQAEEAEPGGLFGGLAAAARSC